MPEIVNVYCSPIKERRPPGLDYEYPHIHARTIRGCIEALHQSPDTAPSSVENLISIQLPGDIQLPSNRPLRNFL